MEDIYNKDLILTKHMAVRSNYRKQVPAPLMS